MKLHPFGPVELQGKTFNVTAVPEASFAGYELSSDQLQVVEVARSDLERLLADDFDPNTIAEDARTNRIRGTGAYVMPIADYAQGAANVVWHGDAHTLRALRQPSVGCDTVAFVVTPSALAELKRR